MDKSWMERTFGESWETSVIGLIGAVLGLVCVWMGIAWKEETLKGIGFTVLSAAFVILGGLARSERASKRAHAEEKKEISELKRREEQSPS